MIDKLTMAATIEKVKKIPGTAAQRAETAQAAAEAAAEEAATHNYGIVVTDGKITQMTSEGTTYDVQDSKAQGAVDVLNTATNIVNYGYGTDFTDTQQSISISRTGVRYVLNGTHSTANATPLKWFLNDTPKMGTGSQPSNLTAIPMVAGHKYRVTMRHISGTASNVVRVNWYKVGTGVSSDVAGTIVGDYCYGEITYNTTDHPNGLIIGIALARRDTGISLSNYTVDVLVEDITFEGDKTIAPLEAMTATGNHAAGDLMMVNGDLYKATAAITAGDTVSQYATVTTVADELATKADATALAAETTARAAEDADIYMEPWQLVAKKRFITEGNTEFAVHRNHIVYTSTSSATARNIRTLVGEYRFVSGTTLGNFTPLATELIPVSVFGSKIKMGFFLDVTDGVTRLPRFGYKFCTVSGDTVTAGSYGTVPEDAVAGQICDATVDVPEGATHVYFGLLFSDGYNVGTYDMVYKVDKGE